MTRPRLLPSALAALLASGWPSWRTRARLILGPETEPHWVRVYIQETEGRWAAMMVEDDVLPPEPGE